MKKSARAGNSSNRLNGPCWNTVNTNQVILIYDTISSLMCHCQSFYNVPSYHVHATQLRDSTITYMLLAAGLTN